VLQLSVLKAGCACGYVVMRLSSSLAVSWNSYWNMMASEHGGTMRVEFVHQMPSVRDAYQAVLKLEDEAPQLVRGSGIILLIRQDGSPDWYFYVDLNDPSGEDKSRILSVMDKAGTRTDRRIDDLLLNPNFGGCFSGDAPRIAAGLGQLLKS
jgi:hypothetical protein